MKTFLFLALVGFAAAECPNACSGHGTCGAKDSCSCYQNYQGNDCSERTCYFGIAHVDTPKGDLNADGYVSGPLTTVVTGSEVYPWGTTEQYPNADANEGHFYMECSNKGICDRKSGTCDCFDGYTGTACTRAACPNDCSGHGSCESIKELAEMRSYDTTAHDTVTTRVAGSSNHHNYDSSVEESYSYDLWDQDKTMGCKCDPVYYGADCSLKKCKYGVDPLFYDNTDGVIKQTTVIHVGSTGTNKAAISGTFKVVFYDVFGEKYVTKGIAARGGTALALREAFEALPNGVVSKNNQDVTGTPPSAVTVSKQKTSGGSHTTSGCIGGGNEGDGAGLGTRGEWGSEYTVTFSSNPGVLKSIELDTRNINNPGAPEYWVANSRQGQFKSRYTINVGRINTLKYGAKYLFTNADWSQASGSTAGTKTVLAAGGDIVKVGGQEFRVVKADANRIVLDQPFLGASIVPVLTDTGTTADANGLTITAAPDPAGADTITVKGVTTTIKATALKSGAKIYINNCPLTTAAPDVSSAAAPGAASLKVNGRSQEGHECAGDLLPTGGGDKIIYRRSDDPNNQNMYKTAGDSAVATGEAVTGTRGSPNVYFTTTGLSAAPAVPITATALAFTTGPDKASFTLSAAIDSGAATTAGSAFFVNGLGPMVASAAFTATALDVTTAADLQNVKDIFGTADISDTNNNMKWGLQVGKASGSATATAGKVLLLNGRRYKIKSRASGTAALAVLTENYAGGQLRQVCGACVTASSANGETLTVNQKVTLAASSQVAVSGFVHEDYLSSLPAAVSDATSVTVSSKGSDGRKTKVHAESGDTWSGASSPATPAPKDLFVLEGGVITTGSIVTEAANANTYHYVAQCSNRGTCDSSTGLCKCFKGYSNDNCDTQNMLAA